MLIAQMTYDMYFGKTVQDTGLQGIEIPAYINEHNTLIIGDNGESQKYVSQTMPCIVKADEFKFFCNHLYRGASKPIPQFLRKGVPYELMQIVDHYRNILCTFLWPCRVDTYFCQCKDCGKKYVIDCYESSYYLAKELNVPTVRCRSCINKRKSV